MPYLRPTLTQLIAQANSDINAHLPADDPFLRYATEGVIARATAGLTHGLHGHCMWLSKQLIPGPNTDAAWVAQWALILRGMTPKAAIKANVQFTITGTNAATCPQHTQWSDGNGNVFDQDALGTISLGSASVSATCTVAGATGNEANGVTLSLVSPVAGINTNGTITATNTSGADQESTQALLARLLFSLASPPKGGGPGDYVTWAEACTTVACTRAWQIANAYGAGTVAVYFVEDNNLSSIIPVAGDVTLMQTYLNGVAPVTAIVTALAPTPSMLNFSICLNPVDGGGVPAGQQAAAKVVIQAALASLVLAQSNMPTCQVSLSEINTVIGLSINNLNFNLVAPAVDQNYTAPNFPVMGTITWS